MIDQEKIYNQCISNDPEERIKAFKQLEYDFLLLPDKQKGWDYLIKLTSDKDSSVRSEAASTLCSVFSHVPDKETAWNDLLRLTRSGPVVPIFHRLSDRNSKYIDVRRKAAEALVSSFHYMPDKQKAWNQVIKLTVKLASDKEYQLRDTVDFLRSAFSKMPDKQKAWDDLHKLTDDKDWHIKYIAASTIGSSFSSVQDKQQAWSDLYRLMNDDTYLLRPVAAPALGSAFVHVPDKQKALNDLIKLTNSENSDVRRGAASALGFAFSHVPDKQKLWNILIELSSDQNRNVRNYANHSLGKICIFQASQAEKDKDYKYELERAIEYFEKASQESEPWSNPSQFCLPFYHSFHTIVFERQQAKEEVNKYLVEARDAVKGSKSKELLFEAVDNLANALKGVQNLDNLKNMDLEAKKGNLDFYRRYCDCAAELMRDTEEAAPFATRAMKKGLPIFEKNLTNVLEEIQIESTIACQVSQGTPTQELACAVNQQVQKLSRNGPEEMKQVMEYLAFTLKEKVSVQSENQYILSKIKQMENEEYIANQLEILAQIVPLIQNVTLLPEDAIKDGFKDLKNGISNISKSCEEIMGEIKEMTVSLKPGPRGELVISHGLQFGGTGAQVVATIPLAEISYPGLPKDLEVIKDRAIKLSELPDKLFNKIRGYLR